MTAAFRIKANKHWHNFAIPEGYGANDITLSQLREYGYLHTTKAGRLRADDVVFLEEVFRKHHLPFANLEALRLLSSAFGKRTELFTPQDALDIIETARRRAEAAFSAVAIYMAQVGVCRPEIKRSSPFLKVIFECVSDGPEAQLKLFAADTIQDIAALGPEHIRRYMFKKALDTTVVMKREPAITIQEQEEYDRLDKLAREIADEMKSRDEQGLFKEKGSYTSAYKELCREKLEIDSAADLIANIILILKANQSSSIHLAGRMVCISGQEFIEEAYNLVKGVTAKHRDDDLYICMHMLSEIYMAMPGALAEEKYDDFFDFGVSMIPILSDGQIQRFMGWHPMYRTNRLKDLKPHLTEEQKNIISRRMQKCLDALDTPTEFTQFDGLEALDKPDAFRTYESLAEFCERIGLKEFPAAQAHRDMMEARIAQRARAKPRRRAPTQS